MDICERSSSLLSCTLPTPLSSFPWTLPPRTSTPSEAPCVSPICASISRKEDYGSTAKTHRPTGSEPNVLDTSDEFNVHPSIFQSLDLNNIYNFGTDYKESANAEIDDEHIRNALASPLFFRRAKQKPI